MINLFRKCNGIIGIFIFTDAHPFLNWLRCWEDHGAGPVETPVKFTSAELYEDKATVNVPGDINASFEAKLAQLLYGQEGFTKGPGLKIRYRFIQFNPGNQFTRWFWGGIGSAGKGSMTVEARFLDSSDRELAKIQSEGEISSGAFGGSFDFAIQKTAEEMAEYAKRFR